MIYYAFAMAGILLTGVSQVLLKIGARNDDTPMGVYLNPFTAAGYSIFLIVTVCAVFALQGLELKLFYALTSLNYVVVMVLSGVVLKEELNVDKLLAVGLIVVGVVVFNL